MVRIFKPYQTQAVSVNRGFRESGHLQLAPKARPYQVEMGQPHPAGLFENSMMMETDQTC